MERTKRTNTDSESSGVCLDLELGGSTDWRRRGRVRIHCDLCLHRIVCKLGFIERWAEWYSMSENWRKMERLRLVNFVEDDET